MERLTQWFDKKVAGIAASLEEKYTAEELIDILANRLAAYEDTGVEPQGVLTAIESSPLVAGWVSMEDSQPPEDGSYIVCTKLGAVCMAHFNTKTGRFGHSFYGVTHWMHRPLPPKKK